MKSILDKLIEDKQLAEETIKELQSHVITKNFKKGEILQQKGVQSPFCFYVRSGMLRSYVIDGKGKEHIYMFAPEGWILGDIIAQTNNKPSELYFDVLEDAEVEVFNRDFLIKNANYAERTFELFAKRSAVLQKRVIMLMSATALERYTDFVNTYPNIVQRVPQKMIASYLGITPESLSKIKAKLVKKNCTK